MKISNLDSSNFRLHSNSVDGRGLSAQDIREKLGLKDIKFSVANIGESHAFDDIKDVVEFSARAKSNALNTGENKPAKAEQSGANSLMTAVDNELAAKGWNLDHYYSLLFMLDVQEANKAFGTRYSISSSGLPDTTEQTVARYNELREQVIKEFSHDTGLLEEHLAALDKGFEDRLVSNAVSTAAHLAAQQLFMSVMDKAEYSEDGFHPLARHKNFNREDFAANARELMKQFAQNYTQQLTDNANNYSAAWESTLKLMNETKTTSVNNLSFNDFKILEETLPGIQGSEYMTRKQAVAAYGDLYKDFSNHEGLSDYLRNALGVA